MPVGHNSLLKRREAFIQPDQSATPTDTLKKASLLLQETSGTEISPENGSPLLEEKFGVQLTIDNEQLTTRTIVGGLVGYKISA